MCENFLFELSAGQSFVSSEAVSVCPQDSSILNFITVVSRFALATRQLNHSSSGIEHLTCGPEVHSQPLSLVRVSLVVMSDVRSLYLYFTSLRFLQMIPKCFPKLH